MRSLVIAIMGVVLLASACSDDEPQVTQAELLAKIEGRELSEAEVEEREQVAEALCRMDEAVLRQLWSQLDNDQLEFQDFVFTRTCAERNALYADATGRFTTE